jgi:uncharacterized membrane protein
MVVIFFVDYLKRFVISNIYMLVFEFQWLAFNTADKLYRSDVLMALPSFENLCFSVYLSTTHELYVLCETYSINGGNEKCTQNFSHTI